MTGVSESLSEADRLDCGDMEQLVAGHDNALNALMDRHGQKLFHYLIRSLDNEDDATDLAQETFVRVYQNRARFDPKQEFSTWLFAIASNLVKDRYRWRSRHPAISIDTEAGNDTRTSLRDHLADARPSPSAAAQAEEQAAAVQRAVAALPDELRLPLILSEYEQKSHAEIAEILGCSPKAIETRIYRARQRLRKTLAPLLD